MNILIADDEFAARSNLKQMLNTLNEQHQLFEAENGKAAINILEDNRIDIAFLDITMPIYSGLDVMKWIGNNKYSCITTLLSSHDEFQYAREAIKLGCFSYILKNELNISLLKKTIDEMLSLISEEVKQVHYEEGLAIIKEKQDLEAMRSVFSSWISSDYSPNPFLKLQNYLKIDYSQNKFIAFTMELHNYFDAMKRYADYDENLFLHAFNNIVEEVLAGNNFFYSTNHTGQCYFLIWYPKISMVTSEMALFQPIINRLEKGFSEVLKIENTIVHTLPISNIEKLWTAFQTIKIIIATNKFYASNGVTCVEDYIIDAKERQNFREEFKTDFAIVLESRSISNIELLFDTTLQKITETHTVINGDDFIRDCENVINTFILNTDKAVPFQLILQDVVDFHILKENVVTHLSPMCIPKELTDKSFVIKKCIILIQQQYNTDINLNYLATTLNINASYLSRIFSAEMKTSITTYINDYRIEQAKKLIRSGYYKLHEVAKLTGFSSAIVFSTVFKKKVGLTPSEFQKNSF